jgi:hypothetical protein
LAIAPAWLLAIVAEKATSKAIPSPAKRAEGNGLRFRVEDEGPMDFASHPGEGQGKRNDTLCRLAGIHLSRGDSLATIEASALAWALRCDPPCEPDGVLRKVRALANKESFRRGGDRTGEEGEGIEAAGFALGTEGMEGKLRANTEARGLSSIPCQHSSANANGLEDGEIPAPSSLILSFQQQQQGEAEANSNDKAEVDAWPTLQADAFHGLAGAIVKAIEPETEADPAAILLSLLTAFGNAIGRNPHFRMNAGTHRTNRLSRNNSR